MRRVSEGAKVLGLGRCPDLGGPDKGGLSVYSNCGCCRTEQNHNSVNSSGKVSSTSPVDATTEHYIHKEDTDTLTIKQLGEKVANLATENSYLQNKIQERSAL